MQFNLTRKLPYIAVNKDAFPSNPAQRAGCTKSFSLPKQAQVLDPEFSYVKVQAQSQLSFALRSQWRSFQKAIALNRTCVLGAFQSGGLSLLRTLASTRSSYGASDPEPNL